MIAGCAGWVHTYYSREESHPSTNKIAATDSVHTNVARPLRSLPPDCPLVEVTYRTIHGSRQRRGATLLGGFC